MVKSLKVRCIVTNKESLFSGDYLKKKIQEYNDVENLQKLYISRDVKTLFKRGYGVMEIRNILNISDDIIIPDETVILQLEQKFKNGSLKVPTINENLSSFTYNKSDPEVESFINKYIIKV
jgi:hypothetical protein|tara:strand:- start:1227 stop:1589 length:363 start_codon:yes stop_codon:yes gene_type:complete